MAITSFIEKVCVQPAVLWSYTGTTDGFGGGEIFFAPVAIKVRWEEEQTITKDSNGLEFVSKATVMIPDSAGEVKRKDFLYLGTLQEINNEPNPKNVFSASEIKRFTKVPMIYSNTIFVKTAFL